MKAATNLARGKEEDGSLRMTAAANATQADSQVALYTVGATAQIVLNVVAGRARALLEHVVRYHVLLLFGIPVCAWDGRQEDRVGGGEPRRFGGVKAWRGRCGSIVYQEGRAVGL